MRRRTSALGVAGRAFLLRKFTQVDRRVLYRAVIRRVAKHELHGSLRARQHHALRIPRGKQQGNYADSFRLALGIRFDLLARRQHFRVLQDDLRNWYGERLRCDRSPAHRHVIRDTESPRRR